MQPEQPTAPLIKDEVVAFLRAAFDDRAPSFPAAVDLNTFAAAGAHLARMQGRRDVIELLSSLASPPAPAPTKRAPAGRLLEFVRSRLSKK